MKKYEAINKVMVSDLKPEDKCLLVELIMRADEDWTCFPSVERLCKARGIKHYKNFKGADHYLPGLVTKTKRGRKNIYTINTPAVEGLLEAGVTSKYNDTPAVEGVYTPAVEGVLEVNTPAVAENTPSVEGPNSTSNTTSKEVSTEDSTTSPVAAAPVDNTPNFKLEEVEEVLEDTQTSLTTEDEEDFEIEWDIEDHPLTRSKQDPAKVQETDNEEDAGMEDSMTKVLNWNRENRPWLTREWDAVEKILADPTYLSNETDCGKKLDAAIVKAHLMAWAS